MASCLAVLLSAACAAAARPNILLITSEDNGAHLSCYGDPYVKTPHLDKLAREGVRFVNAYVTQAGCSQSRASIFTGLYPHQNGQIGLATHGLRMYRKETPNIFGELKRVGYTTGMIGKLHVNPESAFPLDYHNKLGGFSHRDVAKEAKLAREFMQKAEKPFLLMVNYKDAHRPFIKQQKGLPKEPLEPDEIDVLPQIGLDTPNLRKQTADYYNCMMRLDDGVGMLMQAVRDAGKWDNTLVVYLGDHGADILRGKRTSYEGGVKIPLIISWPGRAKGGQARKELVSTIDLMPTFLELAGVANTLDLPGCSLVPMLLGESPNWRDHLYTEFHLHSGHNYYPQRTVRDGRYKLIHNLMAGELNPGYAFTNDRFFDEGEIERVLAESPPHVRAAYARLRIAPKYELYDLEKDPWEFRDVAADPKHRKTRERLAEKLQAWRERTRDPLLAPGNLFRLTAEVASRWVTGSYKKNMTWHYPQYFSGRKSPNVLFIAVDDLRNSVGAFGDPLAVTPNIDALASRGTVFANAHCQIAICNPSRASVMTGLRPDTIRVWGLTRHFRDEKPDVVTLPQLFKRNGYYTHAIGKIYHGSGRASKDPPSWSDEPEFDHCSKLDQYLLPKNRTGKKAAAAESADCEDSDYIDGRVAEAAIRKLRQLKEQGCPFFLAVGFRKPHMPFAAPAKYWALHDRARLATPHPPEMPVGAPDIAGHGWPEARGYLDVPNKGDVPASKIAEMRHGYYAATSYMDAQLGRVLRELDELGLAGNTVISLYGDHGFHVGEQGLWGKLTNYDVATRAPLLFASPFQRDKGGVVRRAVEFLDLYPTLAELCDLSPPPGLAGTSLAPVLDNREAPLRNLAMSQFARPVSYNFTKKRPVNMGYTVRDDRYRYTRWVRFGSGDVLAEEFYDYSRDGTELRNRIQDPECAGHIARLRRALKKTVD